MAKFDLNSVLNSSSLEERSNVFAIKQININLIKPNPKNEYVVDNIDELKFSIEHFGLEQNLVVTPNPDGTYKLLSGHRRYKALLELYNEGNTKFGTVPCIIRNLNNDDSDISELTPEEIEEYRIIMTNSTVRNKTDAERMMEINKLKAFYQKLADNGFELHGRIREIIAENLNLSTATVGRYEFIDKNLSEEGKEEFSSGNLSFGTAHELAHLSNEEQAEILNSTNDVTELTPKQVKDKKEKTIDTLPYESYKIGIENIADVTNVAESINTQLKDCKTLNKKNYAKFLDYKNRAEANLKAIERLLNENKD